MLQNNVTDTKVSGEYNLDNTQFQQRQPEQNRDEL